MFKQLLTACVLSCSLVSPALAGAHENCLQAADYAGCMQVNTHGIPVAESDALSKLRAAMKQVANRLTSGTSLNNALLTFQPVIDAHAVVPLAQQDSEAYRSATLAIRLFDMTRENWYDRIQYTSSYDGHAWVHRKVCEHFTNQVAAFNRAVGSDVIKFTYKVKGLLSVCHRTSARPETLMYNYTIKVLKDGAIDPKVLAAQQAEVKRLAELAAMEAWERHLATRPGLKAWADANPALAEQKRNEWNSRNPQ